MAEDSMDWLLLTVCRTPFVIATIYGQLSWMKSDGFRIAAWVPDPRVDLLRPGGLFYPAWYFFGKASGYWTVTATSNDRLPDDWIYTGKRPNEISNCLGRLADPAPHGQVRA